MIGIIYRYVCYENAHPLLILKIHCGVQLPSAAKLQPRSALRTSRNAACNRSFASRSWSALGIGHAMPPRVSLKTMAAYLAQTRALASRFSFRRLRHSSDEKDDKRFMPGL